MSRTNPFLDYWYAAKAEPLGLRITTPDPVALKTALYTARRDSGDPTLASLAIRTDPTTPNSALWLVNTGGPSHAPTPPDPNGERELEGE